ncbi:hypothetical protein [Massilia genomosp. 1]|uniref:hypothetical protein n=1 Tax=Massilia genomosp. 1 TaxID=2609280 RepID=UPI00142154C0|nr:hypothetical protein [Massilia genomosp. 1]
MSAARAAGMQDVYRRKRELFREGLKGSRRTLLPSDATYFQCVMVEAISPILESEFAQ